MPIPIYDLTVPDAGLGQIVANLPNAFTNAYQTARKSRLDDQKQQTLASLTADGAPDYEKAGLTLLSLGDTTGGAALLGLAEKQKVQAREEEHMRQFGGLAGLGGGAPSQNGVTTMPQSPTPSVYRPQVAEATSEADVQRLEGSVGTPAQRTTASLMRQGVPGTVAAGLSSNMGAESNFNPRAVNPGDGTDGSDSVGMAQWNGDRARRLVEFARQRGESPDNPQTQAAFVAWELQGTERAAADRMAGASTPQEAALAGISYFRPAGYTSSNPGAAAGAQRRVAGADAAALPIGAQQTAQATQSDVPAQGSQEAQFVVPGTGESIPASAVTPRLQNIMRAYMTAPSEATRAKYKTLLDSELAQIKTAKQEARQLVRPLTDPAERARYGIAADDKGPYQIDGNNRVTSIGGSKTTVNVDTKGETKYAEQLGKSLAERMDAISKEGDSARQDTVLLGQLRELGGKIGNMGSGAALQGRLAEFGINVGPNIDEITAFNAIVDKLTPQQRVPGSGASSDLDVKMFKSALPSLLRTPGGNDIILNTLEAIAQDKSARAAIADRALTGELKPQDAIKELRALPDPMAAFKEARKGGFKQTGETKPAAAPAPAQQPLNPASPPTAINPKTGERLQFDPNTNRWVPFS